MTRVKQIIKKRKKRLKSKILMFKICFKLNLFLEMFRNLFSVTYKKPEVYCFNTCPRILKKLWVSHICFEEKKRHHKFSSFHFTHLTVAFDRPQQIKFCMSMRNGLIFPFFMLRPCEKQVSRSQSIFKFTLEDFGIFVSQD